MCFSQSDNQLFDNLKRPIQHAAKSKLWNDKCDYIDLTKTKNLNPLNHNLIVLQINIRGMLTKISELNALLGKCKKLNSPIDIVILCETFLMPDKENCISIPGYCLITKSRTNKKGGGVGILINNKLMYKL